MYFGNNVVVFFLIVMLEKMSYRFNNWMNWKMFNNWKLQLYQPKCLSFWRRCKWIKRENSNLALPSLAIVKWLFRGVFWLCKVGHTSEEAHYISDSDKFWDHNQFPLHWIHTPKKHQTKHTFCLISPSLREYCMLHFKICWQTCHKMAVIIRYCANSIINLKMNLLFS